MSPVSDPKIFTLHGRGLKLDTRADIEPYLTGFDPALIEEVHFGGNTVGIEASEAIADFLGKTTSLKVRVFHFQYPYAHLHLFILSKLPHADHLILFVFFSIIRLPILLISSPVV